MSDVVHDADECARAIERALEAMDPPIEGYAGILQLIAVFAVGDDEWRHFNSKNLKIGDGHTITRTSKRRGVHYLAYGAETIASGQRSWRIQVEKRREYGMFIGVSRNCDRTNGLFNVADSGYAYSAVRCQNILPFGPFDDIQR